MFRCKLQTYFSLFSSVSILDYEQVNIYWVRAFLLVFFIFSEFRDLQFFSILNLETVTFPVTQRRIGMYPGNVTNKIKIKAKNWYWIQDINWTYIRYLEDGIERPSEDVQEVFRTSYVRPCYVLCPESTDDRGNQF